jgi:hypothetical protein
MHFNFRQHADDNERMNTEDNRPMSMGARLFPGVDLTLWLNLVVLALFATALIAGGVAVAVH